MTTYTCIRIEGGLLSPDFLDRITELEGQKPKDFSLEMRRSLVDEISSVWTDAQTYWEAFLHRQARASAESITTITREQWVIPLLEALGYQLTFQRRAAEADGRSYAISHRAGSDESAPPVHVVGYDLDLGSRPPAGRGTLSPHGLVQDYLNRSEHVWAIVTNGYVLRLLRDSVYFTRPAYIEFDLKAMLEGGRLDEFILFYRLAHRTRLPKGIEDAEQCLLERYHQAAIDQGNRIRDGLARAVEEGILILANAFLSHPRNEELRRQVCDDKLTAEEFYRQLLYLIYRLLFLFVSEERNLLLATSSTSESLDTARFYRDNLSLSRLRELASEPLTAPERFDDLYLGLRTLFYMLGDETSATRLGLPILNGELFRELRALDNAWLSNHDLLVAIDKLSYFTPVQEHVRRRVNYAALDVEELGSVYESLLEFQPVVARTDGVLTFAFGAGTERRSTGSFYTAPQLVGELIQNALIPVLQERLRTAKTREDKKRAILSLRVLDLSVGSGHFLLAAARVLARELAKIETDADEPSPEAVRAATREVITHCIHGVDKNPLAVDLCKVALWLEGHAEGKPLTFLDHRIRSGDSLVGVCDLTVLQEGIPDEASESVAGDDRATATTLKRLNRTERTQEGLPFDAADELLHLTTERSVLLGIEDDTPAQIRRKREVFKTLQDQAERDRTACNLWTAAFFVQLTPANLKDKRISTTKILRRYLEVGNVDERFTGMANALAQDRNHLFFHWVLEFPEVLAQGGFDVILGNPPFLGGTKISTTLGDKYRHYLTSIYDPFINRADLCASFYRRAFSLLKKNGIMGMVATNTIGQGDTRESGPSVILKKGGKITFARRFVRWQGAANVEVNLIAIKNGEYTGPVLLDGEPVAFISSFIDSDPEIKPHHLLYNEGKASLGDKLLGIGFVLDKAEADNLIAQDSRNADCLLPYVNGEDLNTSPEQQASRVAICFYDWDLERSAEYPQLLAIVQTRVKPEREKMRNGVSGYANLKKYWWRYQIYLKGLRHAIAPLSRVLVMARITQHHAPCFVPKGSIYNEKTIVFAYDDDYHYSLIQSTIHETWARKYSSTLESRFNYTPGDCFGTFPFPQNPSEETQAQAEKFGAAYHEHRRQIMLARHMGLTATYNLFHNPECKDADIQQLRAMHAEMDRAILACYRLDHLDPQHDFYQNDRGQTRFTVSPTARREILRRLLELNQEIAEKERKAPAVFGSVPSR